MILLLYLIVQKQLLKWPRLQPRRRHLDLKNTQSAFDLLWPSPKEGYKQSTAQEKRCNIQLHLFCLDHVHIVWMRLFFVAIVQEQELPLRIRLSTHGPVRPSRKCWKLQKNTWRISQALNAYASSPYVLTYFDNTHFTVRTSHSISVTGCSFQDLPDWRLSRCKAEKALKGAILLSQGTLAAWCL